MNCPHVAQLLDNIVKNSNGYPVVFGVGRNSKELSWIVSGVGRIQKYKMAVTTSEVLRTEVVKKIEIK